MASKSKLCLSQAQELCRDEVAVERFIRNTRWPNEVR